MSHVFRLRHIHSFTSPNAVAGDYNPCMRYAALLCLCLLTGCAHYEYDLTQPADKRIHVGTDAASTTIDPLRYEMITVESKLVMMIHNPTDEPVTLDASRSYVLDGDGRSRNLAGITIASGSYAKFIFPPPKPYVRDSGFTFGTGIETAGGFHHGAGIGTGVGMETGGPRTVENLDDNYYWDWDDASACKFHLVFSDGSKSFTHDLTLQRVRK